MYFKVIIESGHIGTVKAYETVYYAEADSTVDLFAIVNNDLGLKSKGSGEAITMVKSVDAQEYEAGKIVAWKESISVASAPSPACLDEDHVTQYFEQSPASIQPLDQIITSQIES